MFLFGRKGQGEGLSRKSSKKLKIKRTNLERGLCYFEKG